MGRSKRRTTHWAGPGKIGKFQVTIAFCIRFCLFLMINPRRKIKFQNMLSFLASEIINVKD